MIKYNDIILWDRRLKNGAEALASMDITAVKSALNGVLSDMAYLVSVIETMMQLDEDVHVVFDKAVMRTDRIKKIAIEAGYDPNK